MARRPDRRGHGRPLRLFAGSLIYLALVAGYCKTVDVTLSSIQQPDPNGSPRHYPGVLSTGEPTEVVTIVRCHGLCGPSGFGVEWSTVDPSVAIVTESHHDDEDLDHRLSVAHRTATLRGVAPGTTEVVARSVSDRSVETRASVTVTDELRFGFLAAVDGARATVVGATVAVEADLALYGLPEAVDTSVAWSIEDSDVAIAESASVDAAAAPVYRNTLLLRGNRVGVTAVRATHPMDPHHGLRVVEIPVTIAPEAGTAFVAIRGGDRSIAPEDTVCVSAYVGMPMADPRFEDAGVDWSLTSMGVVAVGWEWARWPQSYPYDVEVCLEALGPGVVELIATSRTCPTASARVTIEVK